MYPLLLFCPSLFALLALSFFFLIASWASSPSSYHHQPCIRVLINTIPANAGLQLHDADLLKGQDQPPIAFDAVRAVTV